MRRKVLGVDARAHAAKKLLCAALVVLSVGYCTPSRVLAVDNEVNYTATTVWGAGDIDDAVSGAISIPFTFNYFGTNFTQLVVSSNGVLTFGPTGSSAFSNGTLPNMTNTVYAFWDDLFLTSYNGASQSSVLYYTAGTAPNRKFIAQWTGPYFFSNRAVQMGTFQVVLYETSNVVQIQYRNILGTGEPQGSSATIGIQGSSSQVLQYSANSVRPELVDGYALKYTPSGSSYTVTTGATYDPVYLIPASGVASPVLSAPTDGATGVSTTPTLSWSPVADATGYKVYLATSSQFTQASLVGGAAQTVGSGTTSWTSTTTLVTGTTYYWRVESLRNALSSMSGTRTFTTSSVTKSAQATLTLVSSANTVGTGSTLNLSTTGGSGSGAVTYAVASGSAFCTISGNVLTGTAAGTCSVTATKAADASFYSVTSTAVSITVQAVVTRTVTYMGNGNTGGAVPASGTGNSGSTFTVASNSGSLIRAGYTFGGWNTAANGSGTTYAAGSGTFTLNADTTLYAVWTANTLTVTYDAQGGSAIASGTTATGSSIASSPGTPTRSGFTFKGWFASASGGSAISFPFTHGQTTNFTLYAQWLINQTGFAITGAPATLAYSGSVSLSTSGGNGSGGVVFATTSPSVCSVNAASGVVVMLAGAGTCSIAATKDTDGTYAATSANVDIAATKASQAALVISGLSSGAYGSTITLSTSGGSSGAPVVWTAGASTACSVSSSGVVTITSAVGTCSIGASMAGNTNYLSVSSADFAITVSKASQSTLTLSTNSVTYGQDLILGVNGGSGTGSVSYVVVSGSCTIVGALLTPGDAGSSCVIKATKESDSNFLERSSTDTSISIGKATQAVLAITTTTVTFGETLVLGVTGGSGSGNISYSVVSGTCTIVGALLTPGDAGSLCVIKATKATDTNYLERSSSNTSVTISKATQSVLSVSTTSATYGATLSLATTGGSGTGVVSYSVVSGSCTVVGALLTPGDAGSSCVVKATKAADTNYLEQSSVNTTVTIGKATQSVLSVSTTSATYGATLSLATTGGSGTGVVSYSVVSGSCTVVGALLTPGDAGSSCVVKANKAADTNYFEISSADTSVSIGKAAQATLAITTTSTTYGQGLTLGVSGGSGVGSVSYSVVSGSCVIAGALLTPGNAGSSCVVKATKSTDTNYLEQSSVNTTVTIGKAQQSPLQIVTVSGTFGIGLSLVTSGGSGIGAVTFVAVSGACQLSGATVNATAAGSTCVVRATKDSDTNYLAVSSADTTLTFAKGSQSSLSITSISATYGTPLNLATAGGSGSGSVSFVVDTGSCTITGSVLNVGDAGSLCLVTATKAGDDDYLSVSSASISISTSKAAQASLTIATTNATFGQGLVLGTNGGSGTGFVSYSVISGSCSIVGALLTPGNAGSNCVIKATKATDTNYLERSSANTTVTIGKAQQTGLSITSATSFTTGASLALTASGGQSSGSLSWSLNSGSCSLSGSTLTASRGGITCVVEVTRSGDSNYFSDTDTQIISVDKIVQMLTFRSTPPNSPVVGMTYTVQIDSDASLAPTVAIANQSASVCSISAGVITFSAVGICLVSASQAGNDVYAAAAASQSITVVAVPVATTIAPSTANQGLSSPSTSTTIPQSAVPAPVSTTSTTSTTTTTTTTIPADPGEPYLVDGQTPELEVGEATAVIRGEVVNVITSTENGQLTMTLPGNVQVKIGTTNSASGEAQVGSDGKLRMYGDTEVTVAVSGFVPGSTYTVFMFSEPLELGRGETGADGSVSDTLLVPGDVDAGEHTLQMNGVGPGDEVVSVSMGFEVMERQSNTRVTFAVIMLAIALALLGGRPIFKRRRVKA